MLRPSRRTLGYSALIFIIIAALLRAWFHFEEDITQPWLPDRPRNTAQIEKAVVIPTVKLGDVRWLKNQAARLEGFTWFVYCMGHNDKRPQCLRPRTKRGREAAAYLSYLVEYYDALPKYSIFIHSDVAQWHNDILGPETYYSLPRVRTEATDALGYANLRCQHHAGCPYSIKPHEPSKKSITDNDERGRFVEIYTHLMNVTKEEVPEVIGAVCCAQFVVSKERVHMRPKSDYERMLNWLADNTVDNDQNKGWVFEIIWHIIFGRDPLYCPPVDQCRCDVYGWCGPLSGSGKVLKAAGSKP